MYVQSYYYEQPNHHKISFNIMLFFLLLYKQRLYVLFFYFYKANKAIITYQNPFRHNIAKVIKAKDWFAF